MALIKCKECGKKISDKSKRCIYCGNSLRESKINKTLIVRFVVYTVLVVLAVSIIFGISSKMKSIKAKDEIFSLVEDNIDLFKDVSKIEFNYDFPPFTCGDYFTLNFYDYDEVTEQFIFKNGKLITQEEYDEDMEASGYTCGRKGYTLSRSETIELENMIKEKLNRE